jgi:uncharacterized membrane protein
VTYVIRAGGFWLMAMFFDATRSVLNALPGSVIAAIIVPLAVRGGTAATAAVVTVLVVMAFRRNDLLAVICGMGGAVLVRRFSL